MHEIYLFLIKGHPNIPNKIMLDPFNLLGLVGLLTYTKQPSVPYKTVQTVSLLSSSILVESICHVDVVRQSGTK